MKHKSIKETLRERGVTHGEFRDNARVSQNIKATIHEDAGYLHLTPIMREALDMIAHKIGRILAGDPTNKDSWHDIAGYATLVEERI